MNTALLPRGSRRSMSSPYCRAMAASAAESSKDASRPRSRRQLSLSRRKSLSARFSAAAAFITTSDGQKRPSSLMTWVMRSSPEKAAARVWPVEMSVKQTPASFSARNRPLI